jgi:hypothetical protein
MSRNPTELGKAQRSAAAESLRRWTGDFALAAAVGAAFYLVAKIVS